MQETNIAPQETLPESTKEQGAPSTADQAPKKAPKKHEITPGEDYAHLNMPPVDGPVLRRALWREWRGSLILFCFASVYVELCLHFCVFGEADLRLVFPILFGLVGGVICTFLCTMLPPIPGRILTVVLVAAQVLFAEVQLVYNSIFGNFMPMSLAQMGGGVIAGYIKLGCAHAKPERIAV